MFFIFQNQRKYCILIGLELYLFTSKVYPFRVFNGTDMPQFTHIIEIALLRSMAESLAGFCITHKAFSCTFTKADSDILYEPNFWLYVITHYWLYSGYT